MIKMISGVCGSPNGLMHPGSGAFSLAPEEEARLVRRGVAVYVQEIVEEPDAPADESEDLADAIGPIGFDDLPEEVEVDEVEEVDLASLSAKELREVGREYGLTFKGNASKAEMIREIEDAQANEIASGGYPAPEFDAAEAVV